MTMLMNATPNQTMTSLEIAELTGKRHDSVKRTIEILSQATDKRPAVIQLPHSVEVKNHLGQSVTHYVFSGEQGKLDSVTITAQLCPELTAAIVKRWQELEAKQATAFDITNPVHLLQAIEIQAKQNIALTQELSIAAPKAQALDVLSNSHGTETVDNCAHAMGIQPRKTLRPWMEKNGWIHKDKDDQWRAKSDRIMAGHLKEASRVITDTSGKPRHKVTVYVTPKGKALLTTRLIQAGVIKGVAV